ncbi:MAG: TRAP transporter small permease subunit [Alphaproteobacteria bacterium]|nr:TRAP transporter small permease subunit [Alphaproteobacteria bacterium]
MSVLQHLDRALHRLYRGCGYLAAALIVLIAGLVLVNIVSRMAGAFVPGMTEGAGYCMAGAGALGLAYTFGEHGHIRVTMLIERLRGRARFGLELWAIGIAGMLLCYLAYFLLRMVYVSYLFEDRSDGSDELLIWIPQAPMAFGFAVFAVSLVHAIVVALATGRLDGRRGGDLVRTAGERA